MSDHKGAALLSDSLPKAKKLLADRGYDADWFRDRLRDKGVTPCIPSRRDRKTPVAYDKHLYKNGTKLRTCLAESKIGEGLQCGMTDVPIRSFRQYVLLLPSSSISINES